MTLKRAWKEAAEDLRFFKALWLLLLQSLQFRLLYFPSLCIRACFRQTFPNGWSGRLYFLGGKNGNSWRIASARTFIFSSEISFKNISHIKIFSMRYAIPHINIPTRKEVKTTINAFPRLLILFLLPFFASTFIPHEVCNVFWLVVHAHAIRLCVPFARVAGRLRFVLAGFCRASDSFASGELLDAHARAMFGGAVNVYYICPLFLLLLALNRPITRLYSA